MQQSLPVFPLRRVWRTRALLAALAGIAGAAPLAAQQPVTPKRTARDTVFRLPEMETRGAHPDSLTPRPALQQIVLPASASVTAQQVTNTVNILDVQDAVKYVPSFFVRKRNYGDTQSVLATRTWGVSSSARSILVADGVPLSAFIANNNTIGGPRWGLVSPEEIARVDVMYGPFSAAYAGNSMGAVVEITTRMPTRFEGSLSQTVAAQRFSLYGTSNTYPTYQTALHVGDRIGNFSFWLSGIYADSKAQPLTYVTAAANPALVNGGFAAQNKLGQAANVLGATGLLGTGMANGRLKLAYDLAPGLQAAYSFGLWRNGADAGVQSYVDSAGKPTYGKLAGFASGNYLLNQLHTSHALSLRTDGRGDWDVEVIGTRYDWNADRQRFPTATTGTDTSFSTAGRVALLSGTGWSTLDLKAAWHAGGAGATHTISFGAHGDQYTLVNPTFNVPDWRTGDSSTSTSLFTRGDGKTRTLALWAQERWRITPDWTLTVGGRLDDWRAYDGINVNGATTVNQAEASSTKFSPKAVLQWAPGGEWRVTASAAKAYRFPTATELYQLVSTGVTFTSPAPNLKPDDVFATELRGEWYGTQARAQVALFRDVVNDAIISQFLPLVPGSSTLYSYLSNVDQVRLQGVELVLGTDGLGVPGLGLMGSITYLDAEILALSGAATATATPGAAVGNQVPNVPKWRATATATYRVSDAVSVSLGARYSDKLYTTLDNADVNTNTYQGFTSWFVADAKVNARIGRGVQASIGVDNLNNAQYFLFHPFPQRTFVGSLRYTL